MEGLILFVFAVIGAVGGSFIGAYTYRLPRGISISKGRSFCSYCKTQINWYDNIPLVSFILLKGRCRKCKKKISIREPLIEATSALLFVALGMTLYTCSPAFCVWQSYSIGLSIVLFAVLTLVFLAIGIIDFENMIIPDELVFVSFLLPFLVVFFLNPQELYQRLLVGFGAGLFLLLINFVTKGKGMGLGDVKLAIPAGFILGWPMTLIWFFLSFTIGAAVGILLIALGRAKLGKKIPFGPFLVISFFLCLYWGNAIVDALFPAFIL